MQMVTDLTSDLILWFGCVQYDNQIQVHLVSVVLYFLKFLIVMTGVSLSYGKLTRQTI